MIKPWIPNPVEESIIIGRTQAVEFVGKLEEEWRKISKDYESKLRYREANIFNTCADMLEAKIEEFANE